MLSDEDSMLANAIIEDKLNSFLFLKRFESVLKGKNLNHTNPN